jgi:hypothetical protein
MGCRRENLKSCKKDIEQINTYRLGPPHVNANTIWGRGTVASEPQPISYIQNVTAKRSTFFYNAISV